MRDFQQAAAGFPASGSLVFPQPIVRYPDKMGTSLSAPSLFSVLSLLVSFFSYIELHDIRSEIKHLEAEETGLRAADPRTREDEPADLSEKDDFRAWRAPMTDAKTAKWK
jgi:hypothetical protein